jgi:hypothetical protein
MSNDDAQVETSLVEAIQNNHIPLLATEDILDRGLLSVSSDAAVRLSQRHVLQSIRDSIDNAVNQIDVFSCSSFPNRCTERVSYHRS